MGIKHYVSRLRFGREPKHRRSMFRTMTTQLIKHERIKTTLPKAKALRHFAERMVTLAKRKPEWKASRMAADYLFEREQVKKLLEVLKPRYMERNGGYTRVLKCGYRKSDKAPMAFIEFVDSPNELGKRIILQKRPKKSLDELDEQIEAHYSKKNGIPIPILNVDIIHNTTTATPSSDSSSSSPAANTTLSNLVEQATEGIRGLLNRKRE
jgi:large subunit ribosomal protein L17